MYEGIFVHHNYTAGEALAYGKLVLASTYPSNPNNNVEMFSYWNNLMGDGSTHLWTDTPEYLLVSHVEEIQVGTNMVQVEVIDVDGLGVENAFVTFLKGNDEIFKSEYTDSNGNVMISFPSSSSGEIIVTVVKHDYKPSQTIINIIDNDISLSIPENNIIINDDNGNEDGIINPSETIHFSISIQNSGLEESSDLDVTLRSTRQNSSHSRRARMPASA
jgi:hypothetical protein